MKKTPFITVLIVFITGTSFFAPAIGYGQTTQTFEQNAEVVKQIVSDLATKRDENDEQKAINRAAKAEQLKAQNNAYFGQYGFSEDAYIAAIKANDTDLVAKMLINKAIVNTKIGYSLSGISMQQPGINVAAAEGSIEMINLFLEKGANLNGLNSSNLFYSSPLSFAVLSDNTKNAEFLVSKGAIVTKYDYGIAKSHNNKPMQALLKDKY